MNFKIPWETYNKIINTDKKDHLDLKKILI